MITEKKQHDAQYRFTLFVDSENPNSHSVVERLRLLCRDYQIEAYTLEIVDLRVDQERFEQKRVIAIPTLDITTPQLCMHRFIGDLSRSDTLIRAIGMGQNADKIGREAVKMREDIAKMRDHIKKPGEGNRMFEAKRETEHD